MMMMIGPIDLLVGRPNTHTGHQLGRDAMRSVVAGYTGRGNGGHNVSPGMGTVAMELANGRALIPHSVASSRSGV